MNKLYNEFFKATEQFNRLKIADMFPEMSKGDCMTLMAIDHYNQEKAEGTLTVSELAEKIHAKPSAVSRTLKNLEERGLIERTVNKADRRNTYVTVSEAGHKLRREVETTMGEFAEAVLKRMNEEDLQKLIDYLNELHQVAEEEIALRVKRRKEKA